MPPPTSDLAGVKRILFLSLLATYGLALQRQPPPPYQNAYPSRAAAPSVEAADAADRWGNNIDADSLHTSLSAQRGSFRDTHPRSASDNERALATLSPAENAAVRGPPAPR